MDTLSPEKLVMNHIITSNHRQTGVYGVVNMNLRMGYQWRIQGGGAHRFHVSWPPSYRTAGSATGYCKKILIDS